MKVLYLSKPPFFDLDLSLVKHLSKYCEVVYLLDIPPYFRKSTAIKIDSAYSKNGIFKADIYPELTEWHDYIKGESFFVINRISKKKLSFSNILLQKTISDFISEIAPDVIHISNFVGVDYLLPLLRYRKKIVITVHDPLPHSGENSYRNKFIRKLNYRIIKNFFILNQQQMPVFQKIINPYKPRNIFLSSLGVYEYLNKYRRISIDQNEQDNEFVFLFFGRISPYKGIDVLLNAFTQIVQKYQEVKLVIAGKGEYWFDISEYQNHENIEIINRYISNDELVFLMERSKIVVCPYRDATQSGVVMSAYALNKPILGTSTGGLPEMVIEEETGYLVEPGNVEELKNKMLYILENREEISLLSENIKRKYNDDERHWAGICKKLIDDYNKI